MEETDDDLHTVRAACAAVRAASGAERVSVWTYNVDADTISPFVAVGDDVPDRERALRWTRLDLDAVPAFAAVISQRATVSIDAAATDERVPARLANELSLRSVWLAPLVVRDRAVGLLSVEPVEAAAASGVEALVPVVASIVGESQAWRIAEQRRAEAELLLGLTTASLETTAASAAVCEPLARQLGVRRASLFLFEEGVLVPHASHNADGKSDARDYEAFRTAPTLPPIVMEAIGGWCTKVANEPDAELIGGWWVERFGIASAVAVPLGVAADPFGVLVLDDPRPRRFTEPVVRLAEAAALHVTRLYELARFSEERERGLKSAAAIRRLLQEGSRARSVTEAATAIARVGCEALDADHACAYLLDDEGVICDVAPVNIEAAWQEQLRASLLGVRSTDLPLGRVLAQTREPVVIADTSASDMLPAQLVSALALRSFAAIPLATPQRFFGCVVYSSSSGTRRWSRDARHLVEQLALESGLLMENAELRAAERARTEQLAHLALHDPLTHLPNRTLLADRLDAAVRATKRSGGQVAVLFVDLTSFKQVNDEFGHDAGDVVLVAVAERMQSVVRPGDTVARLAGDEFVIVLPDVPPGDAARVAERVSEAVAAPIAVGEQEVAVAASVGVALGDAETSSGPLLLTRADAAMYRAKREQGARYAVFDPEVDADRS